MWIGRLATELKIFNSNVHEQTAIIDRKKHSTFFAHIADGEIYETRGKLIM